MELRGLFAALACSAVLASGVRADEACGQILVVSYQGAAGASASITRTKAEAKKRAAALLAEARTKDFAELAKSQSDAPSSAPRGGVMGTYARADWPGLHAAIEAPLFKLKEGQIAPKLIEAPYGYVLVRRCKVEKARARHLLIRYAGAKNAKPEVTRTRDRAQALAEKILAGLRTERDFAAAIAKHSEDSSRDRGGDIGSVGRGRLALAFEQSLFGLRAGERSGVVETEFGFHIIERLPDPN